MGDNCSDDDVPGMEGVSEQSTGDMMVMLTYKILLINNIVHTHWLQGSQLCIHIPDCVCRLTTFPP